MNPSGMIRDLLFSEEPRRPAVFHTRDADCTLGPDCCCIGCGVDHSNDPCLDCGGRGHHLMPEAEGEAPCGWTGEKQQPAKRVAHLPIDCLTCENSTEPVITEGGKFLARELCAACDGAGKVVLCSSKMAPDCLGHVTVEKLDGQGRCEHCAWWAAHGRAA